MKTFAFHSLPLVLLLPLVACGPASETRTPAPHSSASVAAAPSAPPIASASASADVAAPPAPLPAVELVAGKASEGPSQAPKIRFIAPKADQVVALDKAGEFEVKLDLSGWDVPGGGNHVHVILDGRPYKRIDDAKAPIKLKDLDPSYTLAEGQHVVVAFPSRPTHESVKPVGKDVPLAIASFWVGKKGKAAWKATDPTFVFSRPKGANDGPPPAEGLLVDWYLANVELGEGKYAIEAALKGPGLESGTKATITSWTPWRIRNPRDGEYELRMTLVDKDKKPVTGAWNDVSRKFTVNTKAPAPAGHAAPAHDAPAHGAHEHGSHTHGAHTSSPSAPSTAAPSTAAPSTAAPSK